MICIKNKQLDLAHVQFLTFLWTSSVQSGKHSEPDI